MAGHTPGPWRLDPDDLGLVLDPEGSPIQTAGPNSLTGDGQAYANARLIASAPELLEAVRAGGRYSEALRRYQGHGVRGEVIPGTDELERLFMDWHDKGHAALAKAEGR